MALWWAHDPAQLRAEAGQLMAVAGNEVRVSAASAWELAIKVRAGRLALDVGALFDGLLDHGIRLLGVGVDDGIGAGPLDWSHRDPFDRMLVAQARRLQLTIVTRDAAILGYYGVLATAA